VQTPQKKLAALRQQTERKASAPGASGEKEKEAMAAWEAARKVGPEKIMEAVNTVWAAEVSPDLKRSIILSSLTEVRTTGEIETLRFMLEALKDPKSRAATLTEQARGNGLERAEATRLMEILTRNPQLKI
jgi:hypothetical protein